MRAMPPTNTDEGIRAALELRRRRRGFPVVLLSQYVEHVYLDELLGDGAGAIGYLLKDRDDVELVVALRSLQRGGAPIDPMIARRILALLPEEATPVPALLTTGQAGEPDAGPAAEGTGRDRSRHGLPAPGG